jgi:uncharacterized membrane protein
MSCALLDIACHVRGAAWEWWAEIGWLNKLLIVGGLLLIALAATRSLLWLLHKLGGWPAVAGAIAVIVGLVLAILPRKPKGRAADDFTGGEVAGRDAAGPFKFGRKRRQKPRPTIRDWFPRRKAQ